MKLKNQKGKTAQQGIGILELLLVLALIGLALAFVFSNAQKATGKSYDQQILNDVLLIKSEAMAWRGPRPVFTGVSITALTSVGLLNTTWGAGTAINPVGGDYTLAVSGADAAAMRITATDLAAPQCAGLARALALSAAEGTTPSCTGGVLSVTFR